MKEVELAKLFYREIEKQALNEQLGNRQKIAALYRLMKVLFVEVSQNENIQFTSLFARIAYISHRHQLPRQLVFFLNRFRVQARNLLSSKEQPTNHSLQQICWLGIKAISGAVSQLFNTPVPKSTASLIPESATFNFQAAEIKSFKAFARVIALADDRSQSQLIISDQDNPASELRLQYNIPDRNENFKASIEQIQSTFRFPLTLNLIDIQIDKTGIYRPRAWVIEPDFLVDVTAVAECFKDFGTTPLLYLIKKFLPFETTKYLLIGHIANFFLDELMTKPEVTFKEIFPRVFALNPLAFALFDDRQLREVMQSSQKHFINLKRIVLKDLSENDIPVNECFLEPSFYSEKYGLQGRLDVFYPNPEAGQQSAIVELKSGQPFRPNAYGISQNHFTQTLLYDLLIKSAFQDKLAPANYILYSGIDQQQLKFAPVIKAQQIEALQVRNQLVAIEQTLCSILPQGLDKPTIFDLLRPQSIPAAKGFVARDLQLFEQVFTSMRPIDRKYFLAFCSFIAREHQLAKTGLQGVDSANGLAALWLRDFMEKQENFELISYLKIRQNNSKAVDPILIFAKTELTNELANFRNGDIAVLYPFEQATDTVLNNQIFKCTIIQIDNKQVHVRLRSKQFNDSLFQQDTYWNLEHDMLDSGFVSMYRSLFQFAQFPELNKDLLLGIRAPGKQSPQPQPLPQELTIEQKEIFLKALASEDYFLLWGPPGTGKTSLMLKHWVAHLLNHTDEQILLLAYTNRAVDEMCEAIESIDKYASQEYIRIGSRYSTAPRFRKKLLDSHLANIQSRKELKDIIGRHRIFVGTVASVAGKRDLLKLKSFQRVIIDEASQILEPMLVGLLPMFKHFILIGDHQQLPAVVIQDKKHTGIEDSDLKAIGLEYLSDSLFERLYKRAQQQGWDWSYARLSHQGRMHEEIMKLPNDFFYHHSLNILPTHLGRSAEQQAPLVYGLPVEASPLEQELGKQRVLFFPCPSDPDSSTHKTNIHEARLTSQIVAAFLRIYAANKKDFHSNSVGIITPYRAQIAQIRDALRQAHIPLDQLSIDTVERYQGGARDIIIISLCTNDRSQLDMLVSLSNEGVDRKLNVAITRAREQLIILGNPDVLQPNEIYRKLMQQAASPAIFDSEH